MGKYVIVKAVYEREEGVVMQQNIKWADIRKQPELQKLQEGYARLTEISLWFVEGNKVIQPRSLTHEESKEFLTAIDQVVFTMGSDETMAELTYRDGTFFVERHPVFLHNNEKVGYYVFMRKKTDMVSEEMFNWQTKYWIELFNDYVERENELFQLREEIKAHKEIERNMEVEKAKLQQENDYDELTGVHSRSYFYKQMEILDKQNDLLPISLIVGDVNNLKFTNDMFGHRHGDYLLCTIANVLKAQAERMKEETGREIIVARCGGDEFNVLIPGGQRREANYFCHLVTEELKKEKSLCLTPSISLGSAKKSEAHQSLNRLLETADAKMYAVKRAYKQELDQFEEMMEILFARRYLSRSLTDKKTDMVDRFAEYLGWSEMTRSKCRNLIRYQDVGLTIVPERIYRKTGEYTDREWREIKKHPQLGMKLALIRSDLAPISEMMYKTHENYDGSGWPKGISGKAISQEVMAVRLVTEYQDYKEETSSEEACDFVEEEKGRIFEPEMAEKFIEFVSRK